MKQFLVVYYAPAQEVSKLGTATPEEKMASLKPWMDWKADNEENVINFGAPLIPGQGRSANADWQPSNKEVSGFSIVQGENIEAVKEMCNNHPHLAWGPDCHLGVYEFAAM